MGPTWGWLEWMLFLTAWTVPIVLVGRWLWVKVRSKQWWALVVAPPAAFVLIGACSALVKPYFGARAAGANAECQSNLKRLSGALMMYAYDHGDRLPSARTWRSDIAKYVRDEAVFHCPFDRVGPSYAFNVALSGRRLEDVNEPSRTVMLFESSGRDSGTLKDVPRQGRHFGINIVTVESNPRRMMPGREGELIWTLAAVKSAKGSAASPGTE